MKLIFGLTSFQTHLESCACKIVTCPNSNCYMKVERRLVEDHITNVCQWRIIHCCYCNEEHYKCHEEVQWSYMYAPITVKSHGVKWIYGGQLNIVRELFLVNILTLGPEYGIRSNSSEISPVWSTWETINPVNLRFTGNCMLSYSSGYDHLKS